jgi:hypothetical protein
LANYYKGKYKVKNREKYIGNIDNITYRSSWERQVLKWLDENPDVTKFSSEEVVIPYRCATDNKMHRYYVDVWFKTKDNRSFIVEIKPKAQTIAPKPPARRTRRYINEALTYAKNQSKWVAATEFAKDNGIEFQVWTEDTLKAMGIKILNG